MVDPQRMNLYAYVRNSPLRFTDPNGMDLKMGSCPGSATISMCEAAVLDGLPKDDRSHVHFVSGDGKNGFKKGETGITVDADYKSSSGDFKNLQHAANDHSAMAVANFEAYGFQINGNVGVKSGNQVALQSITHVNGDQPLILGPNKLTGYTLDQLWGKPQADVVYSSTTTTEMILLSNTSLEMTTNFYHELVHVVLGDFGRTPYNGQHPKVNKQTEAAEKEATQNAAQQ